MRILKVSAAVAAAGVLIAGVGYSFDKAAPWISKDACFIRVAQSGSGNVGIGIDGCESRFSESTESYKLDYFEYSGLTGRAGFNNGRFNAYLYNGNENYVITQIKVGITDPETEDDDNPVTDYYLMDSYIEPLTTGSATSDVFNEYDEVSWEIAGVWGYPE